MGNGRVVVSVLAKELVRTGMAICGIMCLNSAQEKQTCRESDIQDFYGNVKMELTQRDTMENVVTLDDIRPKEWTEEKAGHHHGRIWWVFNPDTIGTEDLKMHV